MKDGTGEITGSIKLTELRARYLAGVRSHVGMLKDGEKLGADEEYTLNAVQYVNVAGRFLLELGAIKPSDLDEARKRIAKADPLQREETE